MFSSGGWMWATRVAKVLALLFFFLPWLVVSCNGQPLVEASGYQLATGTIDLPDVAVTPEGQNGAIWAIAAMVVIVAGLVVGFLPRGAKFQGRVMAATSAVALLLVAGGMTQMVGKMRGELNEQVDKRGDGESEMDQLERQLARMMGNAVQVEVQSGYWLTLAALLAGVGGGVMAQLPRGAARRDDVSAG